MILSLLRPYPSPLASRHGIDLDFPLLAGCLLLLGLGLVMVTSASSEVAAAQSGNPLYFMYRHLIYLAIGFVSCGVVMLIPMATWQRFGFPLLIIAFLLLVAVLVRDKTVIIPFGSDHIEAGDTVILMAQTSKIMGLEDALK